MIGPGGPYVGPESAPRRGDYKAVPSTWDLPAHTVTTWQDSTVLLTDGNGGHRHMTIPELMRLQTFPPGWNLAGPADGFLRQIGNAVAPDMGRVVMTAIARALG